MTKLYAIQATVGFRTPKGWEGNRELPTFYLHPNAQGTLSEAHAQNIVRRMIEDVAAAVSLSFDLPASAAQIYPTVTATEVEI